MVNLSIKGLEQNLTDNWTKYAGDPAKPLDYLVIPAKGGAKIMSSVAFLVKEAAVCVFYILKGFWLQFRGKLTPVDRKSAQSAEDKMRNQATDVVDTTRKVFIVCKKLFVEHQKMGHAKEFYRTNFA